MSKRKPTTTQMEAAAPDMYEVIQKFTEICDSACLVEDDLPDTKYADVLRLAFAALKKARGEQ